MNPWKTAWLQPRATIRAVVESNPKRSLWILSSVLGFAELMNFFQSMSMGMWMKAIPMLVIAAILCPFFGYAMIALWSFFLYHIGRWLKGTGTFQTVRAAYAWSCVPLAYTIPIWVIILLVFQERMFINYPQEPALGNAASAFLFVLLLTRLVLIIWALVIYFNMLAEVHRFSILRAIGTIIITGVIVGLLTGFLWVVAIYAITGSTGS